MIDGLVILMQGFLQCFLQHTIPVPDTERTGTVLPVIYFDLHGTSIANLVLFWKKARLSL
jgi:hypothetical protein